MRLVDESAFENFAAANFYPAAGGSLIDTTTSAFPRSEDYNCLPRTVGKRADVGAFEWQGDVNPGAPLSEGFKICGEGAFPKTFLLRSQVARGQKL